MIVSHTTQPVTIEAKPVTAPFFRATAVFDKLPATQYQPNRADHILASP